MLTQFMDIIFVESNKRLASQPASQPASLIYYIKERTSESPVTGGFYPSVTGLCSFFLCGKDLACYASE